MIDLRAWRRLRPRPGRLALPAAWALLLVPELVDLVGSGPRRLFAHVAPDTFYYLVVGRNAGLHGSVSYDGVHWSNGFHPLWQAIVSALFALHLPGVGTHLDLVYLVTLGLALLGLATWWLAALFRRADGTLNPLFALLPVGGYGLLAAAAWWVVPLAAQAAENPWEGPEPLYGTLWSAANGMESAAVIAVYAALAWLYASDRWRTTQRGALLLGGLLALLGLARLDHMVFSLALWGFAGWQALAGGRGRDPAGGAIRRRWVEASAVFFLVIAAYLVANRWLFGTAVPISGRMKSTWPVPTLSNAELFVSFYAWLLGNPRPNFPMIWRVLQLAVPFVVALLSPLVLLEIRAAEGGAWRVDWAGPHRRRSQLVGATGLGVVALAGYNFLFVPATCQGNWYYPISTLFVSLVALTLAERGRSRIDPLFTRVPGPRWAGEVLACAALVAGGAWVNARFMHPPGYHARYADFYFDEAPLVRRRFAERPPKLLCLDDGIVAYATGFAAMSATGLGLDLAAGQEMQTGHLLDIALRRGFDHITSLVYIDFSSLTPGSSQEQLRAFVAPLPSGLASAAAHPLAVAYRSARTGFGMVKVGEAAATGPAAAGPSGSPRGESPPP